MNRRNLALASTAGLLVAFFAAALLYERREAAEVEALGAFHLGPPYLRDGAPALGPEDARVVLVEFFDPG